MKQKESFIIYALILVIAGKVMMDKFTKGKFTEQRYDLFQKASAFVKKREGFSQAVYLDSEGHKTAGWGHLLTTVEKIQYNVGDIVPLATLQTWFESDFNKAWDAALSQADEAGMLLEDDFIVALTSVNFQLGTGWTKKFYNTWDFIKKGQFRNAITNLKVSLWQKQTPVRVADFISVLERYV